MKIGIIPNEIKDENFNYTKKIATRLSEFAEVVFHEKVSGAVKNGLFLKKENLYDECDIIIALGGDGTLLSVAHDAALYGKAVLGVNLGRLGFLTGGESKSFYETGYKKLSGNFEIEERMMIEAEVIHVDGTRKKLIALNDIVIKRAEIARMENIDIFIDDELLGNYLSDGVIISTPTGTTAYSLSAGGPIADPALEAMIVTPVCPHLLRARPIVVPSTKIIKVAKPENAADVSAVTSDGKESCMFMGGDRVFIKKSDYKARLVKINDNGFYRLLAQKLD